jgi:hypothetical protein
MILAGNNQARSAIWPLTPHNREVRINTTLPPDAPECLWNESADRCRGVLWHGQSATLLPHEGPKPRRAASWEKFVSWPNLTPLTRQGNLTRRRLPLLRPTFLKTQQARGEAAR